MHDFAELNIESHMPLAAEALRTLDFGISLYRKQNIHCVLVIHGYGSTGKGGVIGRKARSWLKKEEAAGRVKAVVFGEDFDIFNAKARELRCKYQELEDLLRTCNHGVTVVEL